MILLQVALQIPTSNGPAPTIGLPALVYWGLLGFAALLVAIRYFFPSGAQRLNHREKKDNDSLVVLQAQVKQQQKQIDGLIADAKQREKEAEAERRRGAKIEAWNREYRHGLANQTQALLIIAEFCRDTLRLIAEEWTEMPHALKVQIEGIHPPAEVLRRNPLPPYPDDV